jgi:hypothetical protein
MLALLLRQLQIGNDPQPLSVRSSDCGLSCNEECDQCERAKNADPAQAIGAGFFSPLLFISKYPGFLYGFIQDAAKFIRGLLS